MRHRWCWMAVWLALAPLGADRVAHAGGMTGMFHGDRTVDQSTVSHCVQERAWLAYFKDGGGKLAPVRDTLNNDHDGDWIGLRFTEYDGPRIRLGVLSVINKAPEAEDRNGSGRIEVPVAGVQEMLTVALYNTKRFDVIEQKRIAEVEHEQTRKDIVEPSPSTIVNFGKVLGAQYLVYGTVNEWNPDRGKRTMNTGGLLGSGGLLGRLGPVGSLVTNVKGTKHEAEVAITFSLADVASGQVLYTTAQRARLGEWSTSWGGAGGASTTFGENTPVSYAVTACANKAAFEIARFLRNRKWKGTVVEVAKADIFVNAGSQQGMVPQTKLAVFEVERKIVDRETRTVLGEDMRGVGTLEVISVQPAFSVARVVESSQAIKQGDRVELATPPAPEPSRPECAALDAEQSR